VKEQWLKDTLSAQSKARLNCFELVAQNDKTTGDQCWVDTKPQTMDGFSALHRNASSQHAGFKNILTMIERLGSSSVARAMSSSDEFC